MVCARKVAVNLERKCAKIVSRNEARVHAIIVAMNLTRKYERKGARN